MATPAPPRQPMVIARHTNSSRPNGMLPVAHANLRNTPPRPPSAPNRVNNIRLKVIIRRLPPGLTEEGFDHAIGEEWKAGRERVDWVSYRVGRVSKDPAKPSRPSRAYLHLTKQEYLPTLSERVRETAFVDARGCTNDSLLLGPPSVEFAPYGRVPTNRPRKDARQGTIDQDVEFIEFLESLTNPIAKPSAIEAAGEKENKQSKEAIVTPLVQFLRDKKANKGKEAVVTTKTAKHGRQESKDGKPSQGPDKKVTVKGAKDGPAPADKRSASAIKVEKIARDAARETVKVLNKQAGAAGKAAGSAAATPQPAANPVQPVTSPAAPTERRRGNASAAARILERDLGLGGNAGGRRRRDASQPATAASVPGPSTPTKHTTAPVQAAKAATGDVPQQPAAAGPGTAPAGTGDVAPGTKGVLQAPTGPAASRNSSRRTAQGGSGSRNAGQQAPSAPKASAAVPARAAATQAFLKHANPSQGITEVLLEKAFAPFGAVSKVEIDKKKGFAYVDFVTAEGLQKAMAASPVKVGQGQVVVLERKGSAGARNARGGGGAGGAAGGTAARGGSPTVPRGGRGASARGRGSSRGGANGGPTKTPTATAAATAAAAAKADPAVGVPDAPTRRPETDEGPPPT